MYEQGLTVATNALRIEYALSRTLTLRAEAGTVSSLGLYYPAHVRLTRQFRPSTSLATATTRSGSKPNFCCSAFSGADAPKVCMPITLPRLPT